MRLYPKLFLSIVPAALLSGWGIVAYAKKAIHATLIAGVQDIALQKSAQLPRAVAAGFESASETLLLPELQSFQRGTAALFVAALDGAGQVIAHTNVAEVGRKHREQRTLNALSSGLPSAQELQVEGAPALEVFIPILEAPKQETGEDFLVSAGAALNKERRIGTLWLGLPLSEALRTERRISGQIFRIVLVFNGLTIVILLLLTRGLVAPMRLLEAGTEKIRRGDYGAVISVDSGDEIGALARSFNEMSLSLARTTVSKDFFNDILNSMQDQLIVTDPDGRVSLVNPALLALLGYSKEEIVGLHASLLFDEKEGVFNGPNFEKLKNDGLLKDVSSHLFTKAKNRIPVIFSGSILQAKDGVAAGFIGVAKDMSNVRRLEARMHQSEKLSAVGQLAAGVAHEINNPLAVILGFAQGMSPSVKPGDSLEFPIKSIEREALRCKALVQNLLTFARTSQSERGPMDLNQAVEQSLALVRAQAKLTQVRIASSLAAGLPMILGNKNQIEQVIMNLAKNALDAMPGGGSLALSTELLEAAPHSWVCLRVADTGTGIPPALVDKIFEPFFTTKPVGQGTGLGLSLVSEIVKKHSGEVELESGPGKTVFSVKFPARTGRELEEHMKRLQQEKIDAGTGAPYSQR